MVFYVESAHCGATPSNHSWGMDDACCWTILRKFNLIFSNARIVDQVANIRRQAEARGESPSQDAVEEASMAIVIDTRRDWATGIGPLIPRQIC